MRAFETTENTVYREGVGGAEAVIATKTWQLQNLEGVRDYARRKM